MLKRLPTVVLPVLVISVLVFNLAARWLGTMIYKKLTAN
ncbi:phosphate ABC transporter [Bacillus subtilis]|nr:phosphate ABC transporter [Bacillus subtilis]